MSLAFLLFDEQGSCSRWDGFRRRPFGVSLLGYTATLSGCLRVLTTMVKQKRGCNLGGIVFFLGGGLGGAPDPPEQNKNLNFLSLPDRSHEKVLMQTSSTDGIRRWAGLIRRARFE